MVVATKKAPAIRLKWLSQIAEQVNDSMVVTNTDNKIVYANQATIKLFGYSLEELIGKTPSLFNAEKVTPELVGQIYRTVLSGKTYVGQITNKRKNGSTFICELKVTPMYGADGRITGTIGIQRDITERKNLEESLKLRSQLLDSASDLILLHEHNPDNNLMYVNEMMCLTLGYSREDLLKMNMKHIVSPEIHSRFSQHHQVLDESGVINFESAWVCKDGSIVPVEVNARLVEVGSRQLVLASARNISERKHAEKELHLKSHLLDNASDLIFLRDYNSKKILYANEMVCLALGYSKEEMESINFDRIITAEGKRSIPQRARTLLESGRDTFESVYVRKDGSLLPLEVNLRLIEFNNQKLILTSARDITEQVRAEQAVKEERDKAQNYLDIVEVMLIAIDAEQKVTLINRKGCEILGYEQKEIIGKNWFDNFVPKRVRAEVKAVFSKIVSGEIGLNKYYLNPVLNRNGEERIISWHNAVITDREGKFAGTLSSGEDVTERERWLEELRLESELLDDATDTIALHDADGKFLYINKTACKTLGYTKDELMGMGIQGIDVAEYTPAIKAKMQSMAINGSVTFETIHRHKNGSLIPVEVKGRLIESGGRKLILGVSRDISERKKADEALKESEVKFRTLAETSPNMIFINKKGRIVYANEKCETIMGYKKEELCRDEFNFLTLIVPEHRNLVKASFAKHMNGEEVIPIEYTLITKDGRRIEVILSTTLIVYENDTAILGTVTDITDRKKAEEELRESENKYRILTENSLTGIFIEQDEKFVYVNEKFARMHGYEPEELLGKEHWVLIPPNDKEMVKDRVIKRHKGEPVSLVFQRPRIKKDGSVIWAQQIMVAIEYHGKPAIMGNIVDITEVKEATDKRLTALKSTIEAIALTSETRDPYTAGHQHHVAELACAIAREMNLPKEQIEGVRLAGVVHDIGKMYVPAEILSKPGQLSEAEFNMIKMHAKAGYDILKNIEFPWPIAQAVLQHHLRLDGSGYPECEKGKEIIIEARILTVADVVEAMASHRPYRPALGIDKALDEIAQNRGKLYDPDVVDACLRLFNEKEFKL